MKKCLSLLVYIASICGVSSAVAQGSFHTPLRGITVRLQAIPANTIPDTVYASTHPPVNFRLETTTDDDGKFMFGYVPPGIYAVGCSYAACQTAFRKTKHGDIVPDRSEADTVSSGEPLMQISIDAREGMVCRIAVKQMTPDDWSDSQPSATTTIRKDWNDRLAWNSGTGIILRVDGASSIISGKIEAQ